MVLRIIVNRKAMFTIKYNNILHPTLNTKKEIIHIEYLANTPERHVQKTQWKALSQTGDNSPTVIAKLCYEGVSLIGFGCNIRVHGLQILTSYLFPILQP